MCGVAAILDFRPGAFNHNQALMTLSDMLTAQRRRGPDDAGVYQRGRVLLGHRLLRILPCEHSCQPLTSINGGFAISFNGEIYNYRELRRDLISAGVELRTDTDTEVIMELYRIHGVKALAKLRGMFAVCIHDQMRRELILARDRFGQKPLYIACRHGRWLIASSLAAVRGAIGSVEIDESTLRSYLWMLMPMGNRTMVSHVDLLPPGSYARISESGTLVEITGYTSEQNAPSPRSIEDAGESLQELLAAAVQEQTQDLTAIATHLSGGLDSSAISLMSSLKPGVRTDAFCCSYLAEADELRSDERGFEELHYAQQVARDLNIILNPVRIRPEDYLFDLVSVVQATEEPRGNPCLPHFELARVIGQSYKVVLSGEGADELFGGYHWRLRHSLDQHNGEQQFVEALFSAPKAVLKGALQGPWYDYGEVEQYALSRVEASDPASRLRNFLRFEREHFMQYLLLQADRIGGHFGMEARYPFLDQRIVAFADSLPVSMLLGDSATAKPVMREMLRGKLPRQVLDRPKIGFVAPEGGWYGGRLLEMIRHLLLDRESFVKNLFKEGALSTLIQDHASGRCNYRKLIWALLTLEIWHKTVVENVSATVIQERIQGWRFASRNYGLAL